MPPGKKPRKCRCRFTGRAFKPAGVPLTELGQVQLLREELEVLKLCDLDDLTQAEAGELMGVSRGTVQRTLTTARKKVAKALSCGRAIVFEGGGPARRKKE
jgi:predicted DNA-binding protein (UPF0251 family)